MTNMTKSLHQVLIGGRWRDATANGSFRATNPQTRELLVEEYPVSSWEDCNAALDAAAAAFEALRKLPGERIADFLNRQAERIEARVDEIVEQAHKETALPILPRLKEVELPRTTNQLRQAAAADCDASWRMPTIDTKTNIRSYLAPLGPVAVFGPNNFPLAFNGVSGGDYAAAIAAGNPVIAKAHPLHPGTSRLLAEETHHALEDTDMPSGMVQLLYRVQPKDGERLVADPRIGATGFTGSRAAGMRLKSAADLAGKPIYVELSSINPVIVLPGAIEERIDQIAAEFATSCLMAAGQFCTNPGLVILLAGKQSDQLIAEIVRNFEIAPTGIFLSAQVERSLQSSLSVLRENGAELMTGGTLAQQSGFGHSNTLLRITGQQFLDAPSVFQTEAFGNASLLVVARDLSEVAQIVASLEGNLTGSIYSHSNGREDDSYHLIAGALRQRVGRLLNDKMPTGVALSPAMNHGGPFPATGHPHFTAVGIPAALRRFTMLQCFDNVRPHRLPQILRDKNPTRESWRLIDGSLTQGDVVP
jgi:NADP-dependent aldehyde dehydrogenase